MPAETVCPERDTVQATLENLACVAGNGCDVLYLTCHGRLDRDEPLLFLVDEHNRAKVAWGRDLVKVVECWRIQPYLVILASCQSAGREDEARLDPFGALAALGPCLAVAGVPAVLAMQGNVSTETVKELLPEFFEQLLEPANQGSVDLALAIARQRLYLRKRPDYWMPVLFSRMPAGKLWYNPGLNAPGELFTPPSREEAEFRFWDGLMANIARGECTPVLGFGLLESVIGQREDIADQWADRYGYPLGRPDRSDLTRMAQFLAVHQKNQRVPGDQLLRYLRAELLDRLPVGQRATVDARDPHGLLARAAVQLAGGLDPFALLARFPFRVFLSTTPDRLLETALRNQRSLRGPPGLAVAHRALSKRGRVRRFAAAPALGIPTSFPDRLRTNRNMKISQKARN